MTRAAPPADLQGRIAATIERCSLRVGELFSFLFLISLLVISYEVVARYFLSAPTVWAHDLTTMLSAVAFLLAGVYALGRRTHIRVTTVYDRLPARWRANLEVINGVVIACFLALLTYQSARDAVKSIAMWETAGTASRLPLPMVIKIALAGAAGMMLVQALADFRAALHRRRP